MADVRRHRAVVVARRDASGRDRGQLILVTALSLAILFVALALILNTAIYTENLATRSGDIGGATDAVRYHDAARTGGGGLIDYANAHNQTDHATLHANLSAGVASFEDQSARQFVAGDRVVEVSLEGTTNGTRIGQSEASRNFTARDDTANWTVVAGVNDARAVELTVTDPTALNTPGASRIFNLTLTNASGETWRLNLTHSGGTTTVGIKNGLDDHYECPTGSSPVVVDVTGGTVNGDDCFGLDLADGLDGSYDVSIGNGDFTEGTYSMVVDNDALARNAPTATLAADGSGQPFAAHAIYAADLRIVYQTPRLYYNATVRVAPEEPDG